MTEPTAIRETSQWPRLLIAVLAVSFLGLGLRTIITSSPTLDEPGHYRYGHRILRGVSERWDDSKMPVSALNALPCYLSEASGSSKKDADEFAGPCDWTLARVPTLLGGLALGLAIASWSKALFGWAGALVSFVLFAVDPNLLAHSSLITTDIYGALFLLLSLRAFSRWLESPGARESVRLGLTVGLAFLAKYTAAYLPIIFLAAAFFAGKRRTATLSPAHRARGGLLAVGIALAVINAGFLFDGTGSSLRDLHFESPHFRELRKVPVVGSVPLPVPRPFVEGLDRVLHRERSGGGSGNIYLMGELRNPGSEGFPGYFLVVGLFKTPIPSLLAVLIALFLLLRPGGDRFGVDHVTLITAAVAFTVYFNLLFRAQIGLRFYLVATAPLLVLAGVLGPYLAKSRARVSLAAVAFTLSAASGLRHGSDPLSYFNELVDPTLAYKIAADSNLDWGQAKAQVDAWLAAHPDVLLAPARPFPGRILVGANQLSGVITRKRMEWLRESGKIPIAHVAYTHFLFELSEEEARRLRQNRGEPSLPPS